MLSADDARIARKVKRGLLRSMPVKRVLVYGSRARGDPAQYSDLDLYIELDGALNSALRRQISEIAWEVSLDSGIVISTLVGSERLRGQPIVRVIEAEGVAV